MRIGIDLRDVADPARLAELASEADRLGLWAALIGGEPGTEATTAASLATSTEHLHLAVAVDASTEHPLTIAEEISIVDHVSVRRALAVVDGEASVVDQVRRLLHGHIVGGASLAPPPAQTAVPVWALADVAIEALSGELETDRATIDRHRDDGVTHLFVRWPSQVSMLARHLVTRAAGPDFPQVVADVADRIAPLS